jgi:hypothetical protein
MPTRLYFTFAIAIILGVALVFYNKLGGFKEVSYQVTQFPAQYLTGFAYAGNSTDKAFQELMDKAFEAHKSGALQGDFAVVYWGNPDSEDDTIRMAVGTLRPTPSTYLPQGCAQWDLQARPAAEARINAYSVAAPNPDEVNEALRTYAQQQGFAPDSIHIERYASNNELFSYILLKPKG